MGSGVDGSWREPGVWLKIYNATREGSRAGRRRLWRGGGSPGRPRATLVQVKPGAGTRASLAGGRPASEARRDGSLHRRVTGLSSSFATTFTHILFFSWQLSVNAQKTNPSDLTKGSTTSIRKNIFMSQPGESIYFPISNI